MTGMRIKRGKEEENKIRINDRLGIGYISLVCDSECSALEGKQAYA